MRVITRSTPTLIRPTYRRAATLAWSVSQPLDLPPIRISCKEARCKNYLNGWITRVTKGSPQHQWLMASTNRAGTRQCAVRPTPDNPLQVDFVFYAGQNCFAEHVSRPGLSVYHYRTNNQVIRCEAQQWRDVMSEQLYQLERQGIRPTKLGG